MPKFENRTFEGDAQEKDKSGNMVAICLKHSLAKNLFGKLLEWKKMDLGFFYWKFLVLVFYLLILLFIF